MLDAPADNPQVGRQPLEVPGRASRIFRPAALPFALLADAFLQGIEQLAGRAPQPA